MKAHPEIEAYAKQLKDKRVLTLPLEDAKSFYKMRLLQMRQPLPRAQGSRSVKRTREDLVVEAYLQTFYQRNRVTPRSSVELEPELREKIYKFYLAGVLPIRLGGVNL